MHTWRNLISQYKSGCWMLVLTILALMLLPMDFHLHHMDETTNFEHDHVIDLHLITDSAGLAHHQDATVLSATPDILLKQSNNNPLASVALIFLLIQLVVISFNYIQRIYNKSISLPGFYYHLIPPLRAPPH